jgi:hypothetical protein
VFPALADQIKDAHAKPGSALDKLIRDNQDFSHLKDRDATDQIVPPWLKVYWRKGHPEANYDNANDPTGGYPLVLKEVLEWMMSHQDFKPGLPEATMAPGAEFGDRDEETMPRFGRGGRIASEAATAGTNVRTSGSQTAARSESDIRINYWDPTKIISASNNISGSGTQGEYYSTDGGVTWGQTSLPLASGDSYHSDPTVDWSSDGTAWSTTMGINGNTLKVQSYRSANGGATWTFDGTISGSQTNTDKQMQWIDHSATSPYANNNYVIWHNGNPAFMNHRISSGWGTPIQVSDSQATGTCIGADVKTNSAGDVFGFFPDTGSRGIFAVKSTNGGSSYATPVKLVTTYTSYDMGIPADASRRVLLYVSGGAYRNGTTNNVYALWTDLSGDSGCTTSSNEPGTNASSTCKTRVFFSRSTDGGATWSARVKLNNQSGLNDQFNQFLAVDETTGTIGAIYYDTVNDSTRKKVDVYYQMSSDGGVTWQTPVKVTTAMTDETTSGADSGNQYGDYNSLSGYANIFFPSWTDRRSNSYEEIWTSKVTTSTTPTYTISGNAGTTGATLSTGSASATSDSSSNYTISNLAAGSYTVTPSKSGCTFSPTSSPVTITSANVTGVNFTASCTAPTFSISGNAGTTGANVSVGSASATSDASSNYTIASLAAGSYTVTPTKSGCTFSPLSSAVTITSSNVTGINFTATCGSGNTIFSDGFESTGWASAQVSGTAGAWASVTSSTQPSITAHGGTHWADFNSYTSAAGSQTRYYRSASFAIPSTYATVSLTFWMYHDTGYTTDADQVQAQVSTNGTTWTNAGTAVNRYNGSTGWAQVTVDLTAYKGQSIYLGFLGISQYGNDEYVDDVAVTGSGTSTTFSISGNAGTTGANVSVGSASATSDSSSNYTIANLAAGSYTVTPSKSGCTFSPTSSPVTVTSSNVTGVNFTASCSAPTFSISGNAGTTGANVSVGSASATSDSSSNYSIASLAAGSYTVTPTKSGCTFSPVSSPVTITSSNVTGVNFTASCSTNTLFSDGFEAAGWSTAQVSGTAGAWTLVTSSSFPSISAHGPTHWADFNSYTATSGNQTRIYRATGFAVPSTYTTVTLKFWMYHDTGYSTYADKVQAQVSTNGTAWTNAGTAVARYNGTTGWAQVTIDLSAYKGQTVYLGFLGISAYGNDEYLDDVTVTAQ